MKEISVNGKKRTDVGKKATKQLRKEGMVPCNLYGEKKGENGLPEAMAFCASAAELRKAVYTPHVYVVNLNIDGAEHKAIKVGSLSFEGLEIATSKEVIVCSVKATRASRSAAAEAAAE